MKQTVKINRVFGMLLLAGCIIMSMGTLAWSDSDKWNERGNKYESGEGKADSWGQTTGVAVVTNKLYAAECSACHFAYQPGFLPERSWAKIMTSLDDHFGENATLDEASRSAIENYLRGHAADQLPNRFSRSILRSLNTGDTPLRISETGYFKRKHDEVPARMVRDNPKVRSFANCATCHGGADKGSFDEHAVRIPGFGSWED
jgi:mono/diheme cytochrome c family protein